MNTPAAALAWELWWRHRLGLAAVGALVAGFAAYCAAEPVTGQFASVSSIWFMMGLAYAIGVFAYGFEARLEAAESGFPARLFVLPVRTRVLVGWPMLQGMAAAVLLWLAWDGLVLRPCGVETPRWWAVMLAAAVATSQALVWLPFGLPWLRLVVMVAVLIAFVRAPAVLALFGDPLTDPATALTVVAAALIPTAFLLATLGVARARRGDSLGWTWTVPAVRRSAEPARERRPFASALRAQVWYEWRLRGRGYVVTVAAVVAVLAAVALLLEHRSSRANFGLVFLFIPPLIAGLWGSVMGSPGESIRSTALTAFAATRPLDNAAMVRAKFRAATLTAAAAWAFVLLTTAAWLSLTDGYDKLSQVWEGAVERRGVEYATGFCVLFGAVLVLGTWRALVANLWVGLAGRTWMVPAHSFVVSVLAFQLLAEWVLWDSDPVRREKLRVWLPRVMVATVGVKVLVTAWLLWVGVRRGQVKPAAAGKLFVAWALAAAGLFAALAWVVPPSLVTVYGLALAVALFLPLARLAGAPLALAWNRHR